MGGLCFPGAPPYLWSHSLSTGVGWDGEVSLPQLGSGVCPGWVGRSGTCLETPERPGGARVPRHPPAPHATSAAREASRTESHLPKGAVSDSGRGTVLGQQLLTSPCPSTSGPALQASGSLRWGQSSPGLEGPLGAPLPCQTPLRLCV